MSSNKTEQIDDVYAERNLVAITLASIAEAESGWQPSWDTDPVEWGVVWIESPEGQVTWHVPRGLCESSPLPERGYEYDGHSDEQKYDRLVSWGNSKQNSETNRETGFVREGDR